jgi:hypothetical protein
VLALAALLTAYGLLAIWIALGIVVPAGHRCPGCQGGAPAAKRGRTTLTAGPGQGDYSTYLRRFWSPVSWQSAGRHGGRGGIADTEEVRGSTAHLPQASPFTKGNLMRPGHSRRWTGGSVHPACRPRLTACAEEHRSAVSGITASAASATAN